MGVRGAGGVYQTALVGAFLSWFAGYGAAEPVDVYFGGGFEHSRRGLGQDVGMAIEAGEVQGDQEGAGLDIGDLVCEKVRDRLGNFVGRYGVGVA